MHGFPKNASFEETKTFVFSSNARGVTWRLTVSQGHLRAISLLGLILFALAAAALVDYTALQRERAFNSELRRENRRLTFRMNAVKSQLTSLENSLNLVAQSVEKIQKITNLKDRSALTQIAQSAALDDDHTPLAPKGGPLQGINVIGPNFISEALSIKSAPERAPAAKSTTGDERLGERIIVAIEETQNLEQKVLSLMETLVEQRALLAATPSIRPTYGWFSSRFGYRVDPFTGRPALHNGIDFATSPGTPVWASADGVVRFAGYQSGYGQVVVLDHGYGVETRYAHNSKVKVTIGSRVRRRDLIATTGNSGRSTGPHLHYEVRVNGIPVDPINYIIDLE